MDLGERSFGLDLCGFRRVHGLGLAHGALDVRCHGRRAEIGLGVAIGVESRGESLGGCKRFGDRGAGGAGAVASQAAVRVVMVVSVVTATGAVRASALVLATFLEMCMRSVARCLGRRGVCVGMTAGRGFLGAGR